ncbi:hypothetical protein BD414DRAFT_40168 [Trametes punicea]|nr:hypothetical protein BD414DRAFT_40168 [Trametes punicea]
MIQAWKEEIDTLLVFAGLFSAVLTAFNIESYKLLEQQPEDATAAILAQVSAQLNSLSVHPNFVNATRPTDPASLTPPFRASALAVRLNALWFSALVCSLLSASLGLLVKQWLREYLAGSSSISRESIRIRQFRYEGLKRWRVPDLILFLPILLQLALVLFFIGLLDLLWSLHPVVASVITVIVSLGALFALMTSVLPPLYADCPYKSPQSWLLCILTQTFKGVLGAMASHYYCRLERTSDEADPLVSKIDLPTMVHNRLVRAVRQRLQQLSMTRTYSTWKEREKVHVNAAAGTLDLATLAGADATFMDDSFLHGTVRPCINDIEPRAALHCVNRILLRRAPRVIYGLPYWEHNLDSGDKGIIPLMHLLLDLLYRLNQEVEEDEEDESRRHVLITMHRLVRAIPGPTTLGSTSSDASTRVLLRRTFGVLAGVINREHGRATTTPVIRERAFHLMLKLFPRFHAVGPACILTLCTYSKKMHEDNSPYRFVQACCMVVRASAALASTSSTISRSPVADSGSRQESHPNLPNNDKDEPPPDEYMSIRPAVLGVMRDLEDFFSIPTSRAAECRPTMAVLAECAEAVVALAAKDRLAVSPGLVSALTDLFAAVSQASQDVQEDAQEDRADAARQSIRLLRRMYGMGWRANAELT